MLKQITSETVPCNGCTACCANDLIILHPEMGDVVSDYETVIVRHPLKSGFAHALKPQDSGKPGCRYLGSGGCTIYDRRPAICREFACRRLCKAMTRQERKRAVKSGVASKAVFDAGRKRLHTLESADA